jgi:hypothetical protein
LENVKMLGGYVVRGILAMADVPPEFSTVYREFEYKLRVWGLDRVTCGATPDRVVTLEDASIRRTALFPKSDTRRFDESVEYPRPWG